MIQSIDIVEFLSQYTELEQRGDEWWGLSPYQEERTPSFSVRKDPPFFFDYSSGNSGNVYNFVKSYYKCSSSKAVEILKKFAGVEGDLVFQNNKLAAVSVMKRYDKPAETKKSSKSAVLSDDYMLRFEKRPDKLMVWESDGISRASLDKFQVYYDGFSDRLVYPIHNMDGKIVNVSGRTLDPDWKEKKLRKYTYLTGWSDSGINVIYGLYENLKAVQEQHEIILFEGCKSVLLADTWGIHNTGALLTSHLSNNQLRILAGLGCHVVFALDKDVNVLEDKTIKKLTSYVFVEYISDTEGLLNAKDSPTDQGLDTFQRLYDAKMRFRR